MTLKQTAENRIECTLSAEELSARHLGIKDLSYGSPKSHALVDEIIRNASAELGFNVDDLPLVVEAIPMDNDDLTFIITKLEYPEELDTRFSRFTPVDENEYPPEEFEQKAQEINSADLFQHLDRMAKEVSSQPSAVENEAPQKEPAPDSPQGPGPMIYAFNSMEDLISLAKLLAPDHSLPASVYKTGRGQGVLLMVSPGSYNPRQFRNICDIISEYSSKDRRPYGSDSLLEEHYVPMLDKNALEVLAGL